MKQNTFRETATCSKGDLQAVKDALETLRGKWKLQILISLLNGATRFRQIAREIEGISDRMLSKELKELETNKLIQRTVYDAFPPTVAYEPTAHTHTLQNVIHALREWGYFHRKEIMGK